MEGATLEISTKRMATGWLLPLNSTATRSLSLACVHILGSRRLIRSFSRSMYSQFHKMDRCYCNTCLYPANLLTAHIGNIAAFFKLATIPSQTSVHPAISPSCPNWRRSPSDSAQAMPDSLWNFDWEKLSKKEKRRERERKGHEWISPKSPELARHNSCPDLRPKEYYIIQIDQANAFKKMNMYIYIYIWSRFLRSPSPHPWSWSGGPMVIPPPCGCGCCFCIYIYI